MQERLLQAIQENRAPHAILISGPQGSGKRTLARRAAALYCLGADEPARLSGEPNYFEVGNGAVKVEDIRNLLSSAAMQGFNGGRRAFVFLNAQNMSAQIQNTLLKSLEEPHEDTMFVLTGNEFGLLPTIRSRCVIERLGAGSVEQTARALQNDGMNAEDANFYAVLADGITARARAYAAPEAREFRSSAIVLLERAAFTMSPFAETAELVTVSGTDAEPGAKGGKKRKRGDIQRAVLLLEIWQSLLLDALKKQLGAGILKNCDKAALIADIASRFTTARIQGIIETIVNAQQSLVGGANVYLTLDGVLTGLFMKENKEAT